MDVRTFSSDEARAKIDEILRGELAQLLRALCIQTIEAEDVLGHQNGYPYSPELAGAFARHLDSVDQFAQAVRNRRRQLTCQHDWHEPQLGPAVCPRCELALYVNSRGKVTLGP